MLRHNTTRQELIRWLLFPHKQRSLAAGSTQTLRSAAFRGGKEGEALTWGVGLYQIASLPNRGMHVTSLKAWLSVPCLRLQTFLLTWVRGV